MKKYKCSLCGYIYEPQKGDCDAGISPQTTFDDLPEDWTCPICRTAKEKFEEIEMQDVHLGNNPTLKEQQVAPKNDTRFEGTVNNHDYDNNGCG